MVLILEEEINKAMELLRELRGMMLVATGIKEIEFGPTEDIESIRYKELGYGVYQKAN